jgi:hypothetical protein
MPKLNTGTHIGTQFYLVYDLIIEKKLPAAEKTNKSAKNEKKKKKKNVNLRAFTLVTFSYLYPVI